MSLMPDQTPSYTELLEERNLLRAMVDTLPDFIFVKDTQSRFLLNNLAHQRVLRAASQAELWGKSDLDLFPAELAEPYYRDEQAVIQTGQAIVDREEPYLDETGHRRWLSTTKTPLRDSQEKLVGLVGISRDITRRKQAEERLRESETLYQSSLDALPQSVYRIDREGRITFGNQTYLTNLGLTLEECLGKTAYDFFPPELADQYTADDRQVMQTGQISEVVESHRVPATGQKGYVQVIKAPVRNAQGEIIGLQGIFWDVTERYQAQEALAKQAAELETVAQISTIISTLLDRQPMLEHLVSLTQRRFKLYHCHIFLLDESGEKLQIKACGWVEGDPHEGTHDDQVIPLNQAQSLVARAARTRRTVIVNDVQADPGWLPNPRLPETRSELAVPVIRGEQLLGVLDVQSAELNHFTDSEVHILTTLAAQVAGAIKNATLFEQTQGALAETQQSQQLLHSLIDNLPDYVYLKDPQGQFLLANTALARLMGRQSPEELVGKSDFDFYPPELAAQYHADEQALITSGQSLINHEEINLNHETGQTAWTSTSKIPLYNRQGQLWGMVGISRDITERKLAEVTLLRLAQQTELILSSAGGGIFGLNLQGEHTFVNRAAAQLLGYSVDELLNRHSHSLWHHTRPDGRPYPAEECPIYASYRDGQPHQGEEFFWRKDGSGFPVEFTSTPIKEGQKIVGAVVTFQDITERKQIEAALARRATELETVAQISTAISTLLDRQTMLETLVSLTQRRFNLYHCHIFLVDESGENLQIKACGWREGDPHEGNHGDRIIPLNQPQSLVAWAARTRRPVLVNDVQAEPGWLPNPLLPETRSELAVPVTRGEQLLGVLDVQAAALNHFSDNEVQILTTLAAQTAGAIQNAALFEAATQARAEVETQLKQTQILHQLTQELTGALQVDEVIQIFFRACTQMLGFDFAILSLVDQAQQRVKAVAGVNVSDDHLRRANHPLNSGDIMAEIIRTGQTEAVIGADARFDPENVAAEGQAHWGLRLFTPITLRGQHIGLVEVGFKQVVEVTNQESYIKILRNLTDQTALALESAQRYEASQQAARREQRLREVTTRIRSSVDVDSVMRAAAQEVGRALGRPAFVILENTQPLPTASEEGKEPA